MMVVRLAVGEACRVVDEANPTAISTEEIGDGLVVRSRWRVRLTHLHAADRVDGVVHAAAEASPVLRQPPDAAGDHQEDEVQIGRVVPLELRAHHHEVPMLGDEAGGAEDRLGHQSRSHHDDVEEGHETHRHLPAVELGVDEDQRHGDEVGEDEGDHPAEGDPPGPQGGCQGDVAHRADPGDHGDDRSHQCVLEVGPDAVPLEEEGVPELGGDEHGKEPCDQVADGQLLAQHRDVGHGVVRRV